MRKNEFPRIIGLTGFAQSGKNALARFIIEKDESFFEASFADGVRLFLDELNPDLEVLGSDDPWCGVELVTWREAIDRFGYEGMKERTNGRDWMVRVGAGARRTIGETVWVDRVEKILESRRGDRFVVTDVRYPNEAEMISDLGGSVWKVVRPGFEAANIEEAISIADISPDRVVFNTGSLEELRSWAL